MTFSASRICSEKCARASNASSHARFRVAAKVARVDGVSLPERPFVFAGATISPDLQISFPNGHVARLKPKELGILREFSTHAGGLLLKEKLVYAAWGVDANVNSTSVHQYLHLLRRLYRDGGIDLNAFITPESKVGWRITSDSVSPEPLPSSAHDKPTRHPRS